MNSSTTQQLPLLAVSWAQGLLYKRPRGLSLVIGIFSNDPEQSPARLTCTLREKHYNQTSSIPSK